MSEFLSQIPCDSEDVLAHRVEFLHHFRIPEPDDSPPGLADLARPDLILSHSLLISL